MWESPSPYSLRTQGAIPISEGPGGRSSLRAQSWGYRQLALMNGEVARNRSALICDRFRLLASTLTRCYAAKLALCSGVEIIYYRLTPSENVSISREVARALFMD